MTDGAFGEIELITSVMRRELRGIVAALLLIAVTTAVAVLLRQYVGILRGSVLYLVPVMVLGYNFGVIPALITAVAGVLLSGYLYFAQLYSFKVASPQEALNLVLFMVVAVVVSHLSTSAKRHTTIARKREREMSDLYAFSRRLAAAPKRRRDFRRDPESSGQLWFSARWCCSAPPKRATPTTCRSACAPRSPASSRT